MRDIGRIGFPKALSKNLIVAHHRKALQTELFAVYLIHKSLDCRAFNSDAFRRHMLKLGIFKSYHNNRSNKKFIIRF